MAAHTASCRTRRLLLSTATLALLVAPPPARAQGPADGSTGPMQEAGPFEVSLSGCRRQNTQVTCTFDVRNTDSEDRRFVGLSKRHSGVTLNAWLVHGLSQLIDDQGVAYVADRLQLANQASGENGQTSFMVYNGTRPRLTVTFENVGLAVARAARIELKTLVRGPDGKPAPAPMTFRDVPLSGAVSTAGPPSAEVDSVAPRFVVEGQDWRLALRSCERAGDDVVCTLGVTNLGDRNRTLLLLAQNPSGRSTTLGTRLGITSVVGDDGSRYVATQHTVDGKRGARGEQATWEFKPYQRSLVTFRLAGIPPTLRTLPRLDVGAAAMADDATNEFSPTSYSRIPVRYTDVPVAPPR